MGEEDIPCFFGARVVVKVRCCWEVRRRRQGRQQWKMSVEKEDIAAPKFQVVGLKKCEPPQSPSDCIGWAKYKFVAEDGPCCSSVGANLAMKMRAALASKSIGTPKPILD